MNFWLGAVAWGVWLMMGTVVALLQQRDERWLVTFLCTATLLFVDLVSLKFFADLVLRPSEAKSAGKWRNRARVSLVALLRIVPWVGLALLMKTIPPSEVPLAHLLGWVTLPWMVMSMALLPLIFQKNSK